jgi:hypothetical protein
MKTALAIAMVCSLFSAAHCAEKGAPRIVAILNGIVIPKVDFDDVSVEEAVDFARMRSVELDPDPDPTRRGVGLMIWNFRWTKPSSNESSLDLWTDREPGGRRISYQAQNVTLTTLLMEIGKRARLNVHITSMAIVFCPPGKVPFRWDSGGRKEIYQTLYEVPKKQGDNQKANKTQ